MCFFFFNDTATTEIYTLSLHDALPISSPPDAIADTANQSDKALPFVCTSIQAVTMFSKPTITTSARAAFSRSRSSDFGRRSEEHTSELQSRQYLVCRLLLEKKKNKKTI